MNSIKNQRFKGTIKSALHHQALVEKWGPRIDKLRNQILIIGGIAFFVWLVWFDQAVLRDMWEHYTNWHQ